ncbi:MAG: DUF4192 family protein [Leucobacter sp.]|nr:DUF4192 family protein [Leucobacter sp.]
MIRCASTAEFLAAFPFVVGFTASDSLFVMLFQGKRSRQVMRLDLPALNDAHACTALIDSVCELLRTSGAGAEGPALVISTRARFADSGAAPGQDFARAIRRRFRREGWRLRELAVIASDGWTGLLDPAGSRRPRPLAELESNAVRARIPSARSPLPALDDLGALPAADPRRAAAVVSALAQLDARGQEHAAEAVVSGGRGGAGVPGVPGDPGDADVPGDASKAGSIFAAGAAPCASPTWLGGIARVAEACFTGAGRPEPQLVARLIRAAEDPDQWLVLVLTAMSRAAFVIELLEAGSVDPLLRTPVLGAAGTESLGRGSPPAQKPAGDAQLLLHDLSSYQLDPKRLELLIDVLGDAAAHTPSGRRSGLLALLAWAWWVRGMGSVAGAIADEAARLSPTDASATLVRRLVAQPALWLHDPALLDAA